ncbi:MAG: hypothetical protein CM1200mP2_12880 [Planctomycetaceae bacterium]|nr:MAG: hypothetical protein CM1200mP2_12880 [Planctomycetaceae bacterium]
MARWPNRFDEGGPRLLVGAHLDSLPQTPGADDNASGVAALLEIACCLDRELPGDSPAIRSAWNWLPLISRKTGCWAERPGRPISDGTG